MRPSTIDPAAPPIVNLILCAFISSTKFDLPPPLPRCSYLLTTGAAIGTDLYMGAVTENLPGVSRGVVRDAVNDLIHAYMKVSHATS